MLYIRVYRRNYRAIILGTLIIVNSNLYSRNNIIFTISTTAENALHFDFLETIPGVVPSTLISNEIFEYSFQLQRRKGVSKMQYSNALEMSVIRTSEKCDCRCSRLNNFRI